MKIRKLTLCNIGPYYGVNEFNLNTNSKNNIILIGGKNGAGKTTFLKSIKYGMFGSFSLGLKTETVAYFNEIKTLLNNRAKNNYFIQIDFEYIENLVVYNYVIKRQWVLSNDDITEKVSIFNDGVELSDFEAKEVSDKIRAITSPQLINSFIFDGEKIGNIIETDGISAYLEETFNSIFGIDLIKQTESDLKNYLSKRASETNNKSSLENIGLVNDISLAKNRISALEKTISDNSKKISNYKTVKKANTENFYKLGGLTKEEQAKFNQKINKAIIDKETMNKQIRSFIETDLPLIMCKRQLEDVFERVQIENHVKYIKYIDEIEKFIDYDFSNIRKLLLDKIGFNYDIIHGISNEDNDKLLLKIGHLETSLYNNEHFLNKRSSSDEYNLLKKRLENNENIHIISELIDENKSIDIAISALELDNQKLEEELSALRESLDSMYLLYEKNSELIKKESLADSSYITANETLKMCQKFRDELTKSKLRAVSKKALSIFNDTIRKEDFISKLSIDDEYNLKLLNSDGIIINPRGLSAGEMQLLVSSIIWAMFKESGRREMFIFDTPLARLDVINRKNFIEKIISTISSQVVILSTDSEFVSENLKLINNRISKKYLLLYNNDTGKTDIANDYFGGDDK